MNVVAAQDIAPRDLRRVIVIGCSGSGKSTLSARLSNVLGLPHLSMDREFFWLPGWKLRERGEIRRMIAGAVAGERWIMDGNSAGTLDIRLPRADLVVWLRLPRRLCLFRVVRRWMRYAGRTRPDMADGCPEKIDLEFLRYVWNFEKKEAPQIRAMIEQHRPDVPVLVLRRPGEVNALVARVEAAV